MTPLQQAIRESDARLRLELKSALSRCKTDYERQQCRLAYGKIFRESADVITQRFGEKPELRQLNK